MQERDLPFIMEIERLSFPNPWQESSFQGEIDNLHISYPSVIVQRPHERVIGYIIFWYVADEAQISNFAINPDFRNLGVGESVLKETLSVIRTMGARHVVLEVRPSNTPALSLYRKHGFGLLGIRKGYYRDPDEDALVMIHHFEPGGDA
jgi:ribosomal-protein-alanine N-acetyltransferase